LTEKDKNALTALIKWGDRGYSLNYPEKLKLIAIQHNSKITDADIEFLKHFPNLESLYIVKCPKITDEGMDILEYLPHLKILSLGGTNVTEASVPSIAKLKSLENLYIGVQYYKNDPTITEESTWGNQLPQFGDKTLDILQFSSLKKLAIDSPSSITDKGLPYLKSMNKLEEFHVIANSITIEGAEYLSNIPHLKLVHIWKTSTKCIPLKIQQGKTLVLYYDTIQ
jgi:hypothetical protein